MDNGGGQGIFPTTNSTDPTNKNKDDGEDFIAFTVILDANEFLKKLLIQAQWCSVYWNKRNVR